MKSIPVKKFLDLWDQLLKIEWEQDAGLAKRIGLTPTAVYHWRAEDVVKVRPSIIKSIEEKLSVKVSLSSTGKWVIDKVTSVKEPKSLYSRAHLSETEGGLSSEDVKLLDNLSNQLSQIAKQIDEIKNKKRK